MKLYSRLSAIALMCAAFVAPMALTSCNEGDDLDTNQYTGGVKLLSFGPSPVARGGELRFLGNGLNQVNSIEIPGCAAITDINVVSPQEIRITVPQTAEPGFLVLNYSGGKITTLTELTYSEPISIDAISPASVKPGQAITISGEYLNLIKEVCFPFLTDSVNVFADDFIEHTRQTIKVVVPEEAISGKLILSDAAADIPNMIYADDELTVALPAVAAALDVTNAKPGDVITITGTDLELVRKIEMPNGDEVDFTYADGKITFTLPDNASDGAIVMIPASGVKVAIANIGMVVPTEMVATPAEGLRGGDEITIKGLNMDQVVSVVFPNVADAVEPTSVSATEVKVNMPASAHSGELTLNLKSGKTVAIAVATAKPENVAYTPTPAPAGGELTIEGKNLDLVVKIAYTGGTEVEVAAPEATKIVTIVPLTAQSGPLTLTLANGETVEAPALEVALPSIAYVTDVPGDDAEINAGEILMLPIANEGKLTDVLVNGAAVQYILNGTNLYINVPATAGGSTTFTLVSGNEKLDYVLNVIPATHVENVIFDQIIDLSWSGDEGVNKFRIYKESFEGVPAGALLVFHVKPGVEAQIQVNHANWGQIAMLTPSPDDTEAQLELTADVLNTILTTNDGWSNTALVIQGQNCVVNKVTVEWENELETLVPFDDSVYGTDLGSYSINLEGKPGSAFIDAGVKVGQKLRIYLEPYADYNYTDANVHLQLFDGHWGALTFPEINGGNQFNEITWGDMTCVTIDIDQSLYDKLVTFTDWGYCMIFQGKNVILKKVTVGP